MHVIVVIWINSTKVRAQAFTVGGQGGLITKLTLEDAYSNPFTSGYYVGIYSDNTGQIGSRLVTFESSPYHVPWTRYLEFDPLSSYILQANTTYWVYADMSYNSFYWNYKNSTTITTGTFPATGYRAYSVDGINFSYDGDISSSIYGTGYWHYTFKLTVDTAGDTTPPTITSISSNTSNGYYNAGDVIDIDVTFSEPVTSTGDITVTLETGDTDRTCTFTVTNSTTGTCNYTVQEGDTSADLNATVLGTIKDTNNNTMVNFTPTTSLATNKALVVDTETPSISSISSDKANGAYTVGDVVDIDVTFNDQVTSSGDITVTLRTGDTDRTCTFSVSNSTTGTCNYTVQEGDTSSDLDAIVSGTFEDRAGNSATVSSFSPSLTLALNKDIVIDTDACGISDISESASDTSAEITFTTNEDTSSKVVYGLTTSQLGLETSASNTTSTVPETITLSGLNSCAHYYYQVVATDNGGNETTSSEHSFYTSGCGASSASSGGGGRVTTSGGTVTVDTSSGTVSIIAPEDYYSEDLDIQINILDISSAPSMSDGKSLVGDNFFDLLAAETSGSQVDSFLQNVTFTIDYGEGVESTFVENTLDVYKYEEGSWGDKNCELDEDANTLTCTLSTFSVYGVFGDPVSSSSSASSDSSSSSSCGYKTPPEITWIKLEPMIKDGVTGMYVTWTQYGADRVNIKIDDGTDNYPWKMHKISNDGHEFLPNVSSWQNIIIKPINHCAEGNYSAPVSYSLYPLGWYGF